MPQCQAFYLIEHLFDAGLTMGDKPITHGELESYQRNIGIKLVPWEIKSLKSLSEAYLAESRAATDKDAETAWDEAPGYMSAAYRRAMRVKANNRKLAEMR